MNDLINIRDFSVSYCHKDSNIQVIKDLNLIIKEKQIVSIIGESGSGKTTLIRAIMDLLPVNSIKSGEISIFNVNNTNKKEMSFLYGNKIGMIMQDPFMALNPTLKIKHQVSLIMKKKYGKLTKKEIFNKSIDLLRKFGFLNPELILNKYPAELSGGMNQKINIALSLELEPNILILDEPTSALDYDSQEEIINFIMEYYKKNYMTIIFITHNIVLAKQISNRIIVMKDGEIVDDVIKTNEVFLLKSHYSKILYDNAIYIKREKSKDFSQNKLFELNNITKKFCNKEVLRKINITLYKGETLGIIGKTGCGKTTLCKILCGIYKPDEGSMNLSKNLNIEMVFQSAKSSLDLKQTVRSIFNENNKINKRKMYNDETLLKYINDFNLPNDTLERYPTDFSGGQNQKIAIIRALLNKPDIIIFDEPTSSLDVSSQKDILDIINQVKEKYLLTYIFISHNPQVINYMCNRIIELS